MDCWNCEKNIDKQASFEVITQEGIVRICKECFEKENFPSLNRKKTDIAPRYVYPKKEHENKEKENLFLKNQELKKISNQNYSQRMLESKPNDLIDNFHWVIMRARRSKKITQEQFAKEIKEPEIAIKKIEQGKLPEKYSEIIKKIETALRINLLKEKKTDSFEKEVEEAKKTLVENIDEGKIQFDELITRTLTIDDLKDMKAQREGKIFQKKTELIPRKKPADNEPEFTEKDIRDKKELTEQEINDIIFGKK
jgi:ribosome-binding protein aMBF1 (putative translation factor)